MRTVMMMCLAAACVLVAAPVRAQERIHAWAEGRYMQDRERMLDIEPQIGTLGGVALGVDFSRRFGIEVGLDWPQSYRRLRQGNFNPQGGGNRVVETTTQDRPDVSVSFAAHVIDADRVRFTLLVGQGRVPRRQTQTVDETLGPNREVLGRLERQRRDEDAANGAAFGADVAVRLIGALSVVPSVHGVFLPADTNGIWFVRPAIGVRWTF